MDTTPLCPGCGNPLKGDAPRGLCPQCLMKGAFHTTADAGAPSARFEPPNVADIAGLFPQLEIIGLIGKGGMGAVYKARQPALDRFIALKVLPPVMADDPGFAERFNREARALARLNHPNIVTVYDFGKAGALHYLVMEFVDGTNLREIELAGNLSPEKALTIVPQICDALQFAHSEGIVHRDIKPENLLLDKKGRLKITDFGIAKIIGSPAGKTSLTGAKDVVGTPHYMSPEQIEKPQMVDHRADIYSLGVVFYEMLTGELPLGRFQPPSKKVQIDVRLDDIVLRTLEKEPERRYQQAGEVKTEVETVAATSHFGKGPSEGVRARRRKQDYFGYRFAIPLPALVIAIPCLAFLLFFAAYAIHNTASRHSANQNRQIMTNTPSSVVSQDSVDAGPNQTASHPPASAKTRTNEPDNLRDAISKLELKDDAKALETLTALEETNLNRSASNDLPESLAELANLRSRYAEQNSEAQEALARLRELERMDKSSLKSEIQEAKAAAETEAAKAKADASNALTEISTLKETNWTDPDLSTQDLQMAGIYQERDEFRKNYRRSFPLDGNGQFSITDIRGRIEIQGWNSNVIVLEAVIHGKTAVSVAATKIDVDSSPSRVAVRTTLPSRVNDSSSSWDWWDTNEIGSSSIDYVVRVPLYARLENVNTVSGTVVIGGMAGDISASTVSGAIRVKNAARNLDLSTVNGSVAADMDKLGAGQSVGLHTVNGHIKLSLPENADANFSMTTFSGSISSDFPGLTLTRQSPSGWDSRLDGSLRDGAASVSGNTVSGVIKILKAQ